MKNILEEINHIETILKGEILEARDFYGEHTDDAEMYIGQLTDKRRQKIYDILDEYDPENLIVFDNGKWIMK